MKRKIIIVEPSEIIKLGLKALVSGFSTYEVAACLDDLTNIEEKIAFFHPEIIIINPSILPYYRQMSLPPALLSDSESLSNVALVHQYTDPSLLRLFDATINIRDGRESIIETLNSLEGNKKDKKASDSSDLTKRETDILVLVAKGMMSKEIADKLNISIHTVISHRKNITKKTGIKSVAGLAVYAMLNNLMDEG